MINPKGIFKLMPVQGGAAGKNVSINASSFSNPAIVGLAVRQAWEDLEKTQGVRDWSFFDNAVALAASAGKKVALSLIAGCTSPAWLTPLCSQILSLTNADAKRGNSVIAPWDSVYKTYWSAAIQDFGARYTGNPAVAYVTATGMGHAEECYLLDDSGDVGQWDASAWSQACSDIIGAYAAAFGDATPFVVTWGKPAAVSGWDQVMQNVYSINYNFGFKADSLSATFPNLNILEGQTAKDIMAAQGYPVVMQMLGVCGTELQAALDNGAAMGATAFELYANDLTSANLSILSAYN